MSKNFVIDDRLAFYGSRNELSSQNRHDMSEILNAPCARCLEVLLNAPGQIISQTELFKAGWGDDWKEVSPNTLYQNIMLARKALRNVSESEKEFIITVPRKGFKFNEVIPVTECDLEPLSDNKEATESVKEDTTSARNSLSKILFRLLIPAAFLFLALASSIFVLQKFRFDRIYFDDFKSEFIYSHSNLGCEFYLNKRNPLSITEMEHFLTRSSDITSDCSSFPLRYITPYRNDLSVFYLACNSKSEADRICRSGYLRLSK